MDTKSMFDLTGKTAIVTGGGRGLGIGITMALCESGAEVLIIGSSPDTPEIAKRLAGEAYKIQGLRYDLSELNGIEAAFERAVEMLGGKLDILVNNAAVQRRYPAEDFPFEEWNRVMNVNLSATFLLCQCAGRHMLARGHGKIINIASITSFFGSYNIPAYAASKGGMAQLTKALSNEWTSRGINVNAIAPGGFATEMTDKLREDVKGNDLAMARTPAGRWGVADDIKGTIVYLASAASDYVCGVILPVDGGYLVR